MHPLSPPIPFAAALALGLCATAAAHAADSSCAALSRAVNAGMAQPRIHAAIDSPIDAAALKMGMKQTLMHSIVIGKVQHSNATNGRFSPVSVAEPAMRQMATDLAAFAAEGGCQALGPQRVAGYSAVAYGFSMDLGRGEAKVRVWVDGASGLPVRAVSDEPDFDVDVNWSKPDAAKSGKAGSSSVQIKERPNGKRVVATHAYLYGDAVKPPDASGAVDAGALAQLQALLKGAP